MITDFQVRRLREAMNRDKTLEQAAVSAGMSVKSAGKYKSGKLPSEMKKDHVWRTRKDPFEAVWPEILPFLKENSGLEAKTLFEYLNEHHAGKFQEGQLRTLQRKIRRWRATEGPAKEVFFPQKHFPGDIGASDFTHMGELKVTIKGEPFDHLFYHFVLTYSNWEAGSICFSESYESLSEGLQNALWSLGGAPRSHRTDRMSAAINKDFSREMFTDRYGALLRHYEMKGLAINACKANENGDAEQGNNRFKIAVDQALMLRGNRNFENREEYEQFLAAVLKKRNTTRQVRFLEEILFLKKLPAKKLADTRSISLKVGKSSTINILRNTYSVDSRFIGESIDVEISSEFLEVWYENKMFHKIPRLRGEAKSTINYRHIIDWLVRKPGAFEHYKFRDNLFPTTTFRITYDLLKEKYPDTANKKYLAILNYAAKESETRVEQVLKLLTEQNIVPLLEKVIEEASLSDKNLSRIEPEVPEINLELYDTMLSCGGVL